MARRPAHVPSVTVVTMLVLAALAVFVHAGASGTVTDVAPARPVAKDSAFADAIQAAGGSASLLPSAPEGAVVRQVWHLGRITGDLARIVDFYHDLLGLGLRGTREAALRFARNPTIDEFVDVPSEGEYRAAFLPIPGASAETQVNNQVYVEAFEWRNVDRRQMLPPLTSPGASSLRFLVRDLDGLQTALRAAGTVVLTRGGAPLAVPAPTGLRGDARAIVVRDPDGYPVELMQLSPAPQSFAAPDSRVLGAQMTVVVADLDASLDFYRRFVGDDLQATAPSAWQTSSALNDLRAMPAVSYRTAMLTLPGSSVGLELMQIRGVATTAYRPVFQDIGLGHVAVVVRDIEAALARLKSAGASTLARSGTWTRFSPTLRGLYTRDRDGFFLEVIERP